MVNDSFNPELIEFRDYGSWIWFEQLLQLAGYRLKLHIGQLSLDEYLPQNRHKFWFTDVLYLFIKANLSSGFDRCAFLAAIADLVECKQQLILNNQD